MDDKSFPEMSYFYKIQYNCWWNSHSNVD